MIKLNKTEISIGYSIAFVFILILVSFYYDLHQTSFMRPQGLHQWRQSIGATYAKNYYNYDLKPSESRIYNYIVDEGNSDKAFAEFPILYYSVAVLYKIFGPHESIFRIFNLLILFLGLFYLMRLLKLMLHNNMWALLLSLLTFTSATLVYYSNSFLPDTTSFAITFIALFQLARFHQSDRIKYLWFTALLFSLSGLIKITSLVPFLALSATFVLFLIVDTDLRKKYPLRKMVLPFLMPLVLSFSWYFFVSMYHNKYGGNISAVEIRPIWRLSADVIQVTWQRIWREWIWTYFHPSVLMLAAVVMIVSLFFMKRLNRFLITFQVLAILGSTVFFFLFFRSLKNHDYYLINLFYLVIFALAFGVKLLLSSSLPKWAHTALKVVFMVFLFFLVTQTKVEIDKKLRVYNKWHVRWFHGLENIEPELRKVGIQQTDKVISIPDPSINISLNMMNQPGYTDFLRMSLPLDERIDYQISKGAKYLILGDSLLYQKDKRAYVEKYMKKKILTHENIVVYDLRGFE